MLSFQMGEIKVCVLCYETNNVDNPDTHKHDPYGDGMVLFDKFTANYFNQKKIAKNRCECVFSGIIN